jgi:hypothetical protein
VVSQTPVRFRREREKNDGCGSRENSYYTMFTWGTKLNLWSSRWFPLGEGSAQDSLGVRELPFDFVFSIRQDIEINRKRRRKKRRNTGQKPLV